MSVQVPETRSAGCRCGAVALTLRGTPMVTAVCYCDTCQEGSRRIEALPHAPHVREPDGGTAYTLYRKDRVAYTMGSDLLHDMRLDERSKTNRVVASCCNTAMIMRFDDARHWIPVYRARLGAAAPAIQMRICTSFATERATIPNDVPAHSGYPPALVGRLVAARLAMLFGS